ncbi:class I SAM-dependent methyltransferase [Porticoccaceae bacterium]|nr:class I SAM-dependent methyltransferase [Porticoccaceae bacterium]
MNRILKCYLCGSDRSSKVSGKVRDCEEIGIRKCDDCGLVYLDTHDHLSENFYNKSYDKEIFDQWDHQTYLNYCKVDDDRRLSQILPHVSNRSYLDVGCGAGGVAISGEKFCSEISVVEPMEKWRNMLEKKGVDVFKSAAELGDRKYDVISMFHVLEHIKDPISFLKQYKDNLAKDGVMLVEVPSSDDVLLKLYESEVFSEFSYWSPHLFLFNPDTLAKVVNKAGCEVVSIQQVQRYPLSNHLKWLAKSTGGGHIDWSFLDSPDLSSAYESQLAKLGMCDTIFAWIKRK